MVRMAHIPRVASDESHWQVYVAMRDSCYLIRKAMLRSHEVTVESLGRADVSVAGWEYAGLLEALGASASRCCTA